MLAIGTGDEQLAADLAAVAGRQRVVVAWSVPSLLAHVSDDGRRRICGAVIDVHLGGSLYRAIETVPLLHRMRPGLPTVIVSDAGEEERLEAIRYGALVVLPRWLIDRAPDVIERARRWRGPSPLLH